MADERALTALIEDLRYELRETQGLLRKNIEEVAPLRRQYARLRQAAREALKVGDWKPLQAALDVEDL